jgi:catechol 2,3-dioxygenase-like lactoylglutathione lyase family enzyme
MLKLGSMRLELFPADQAHSMNQKGGERAIGFKHLAFDVPKLESAMESLRADGIQFDTVIEQDHVTPGLRIVFFRDLEGNIIELMEGYRDEV